MTLQNFVLPHEGWQVCVHQHVPLSELVDVSDRDTWDWKPARLPFDVISHLVETKVIEDPLVGLNDLLCRWVEDADWVLRCNFDIPDNTFCSDDDLLLFLNDVDCYGSVFLNGTLIGKTRNQFHPYFLEIEELKCSGSNELLIYLRSAKLVNAVLEQAHGVLPAAFDTGRVHARRMQCLTGWDWTSRLSCVGMLTVPEIRTQPGFSISSLYASTVQVDESLPMQPTAERARVAVAVEITARRKGTGQLLLKIIEPDSGAVAGEVLEQVSLKARPLYIRLHIDIKQPRLWWPLGMGEQPLYRCEVILTAVDRVGNEFTCTADDDFGIRTIGLERLKEGDGESFRPMVNGHAIFCRGVNWIPTTMLPSQRCADDYKLLVASVARAGMNCIRVWGGGTYEVDDFYTLCDRLGILVWQDFMFSCAAYPVYRQYIDEVEAEATYQVTRLRNHPSIMLWCGNNENEWLHQVGQLRKGNEQHVIGERLWADLIRSVCEELDPSRPYHQSSPFGKNRLDPNDESSGDRHHWDAWSGWESPQVYMQDRGRFISEFGFQSMPALETIQQFASGADSIDHPELLHHQKMIEGQERLARYAAELYAMPVDLQGWVETTQAVQAEVLRRAVEHWRRERGHTSGALIWTNHDAYPAISWSLIDFYRRPKQAWFAARQFFSPVLMSIGFYLGTDEYGAIPLSAWSYGHEACGIGQPRFQSQQEVCSPGETPVVVKLRLINDTGLELAGEIKLRIFRESEEPVLLESQAVTVGANSESIELVRSFAIYQLQPLRSLRLEAAFVPDATTSEKLKALEGMINAACDEVAGSDGAYPPFSISEGLSRSSGFVEPKYLK